MPKTTAELTELVDRFGEALAVAQSELATLRTARQQDSELLRTTREECVRTRQELTDTRRQLDDERAVGRARDEKIVELQKKNAALEARGDEHGKQIEHLATRVWGLIIVLLVAALGFIGYSLRK